MSKGYIYGALVLYTLIHFGARAMPFVLLNGKKIPDWLLHLSDNLPGAIMAILVVYNLRSTVFTVAPYGLPELVAVAVAVVSFIIRENMVLTLVLATGIYCFLLAVV